MFGLAKFSRNRRGLLAKGEDPALAYSTILVLTGLYIAQAIPIYLVAAALPAIFREQGISLVAIGSLAILMLPWVLKFLWAPIVDRYYFKSIGKRRSWIIPAQLISVVIVLILAGLDPAQDQKLLFPLLMMLALSSATQDIATDGYAVEHLPDVWQPLGNAIQGGSVAAGVLLGGSLSLFMHDMFGWSVALGSAATLSFLALLPILFTKEATGLRKDASFECAFSAKPSIFTFFSSRNSLIILCFAMLFRLPEGLIKGVEQAFLVDFGFSLSQIGVVSGGSAACVGLGGSAAAVVVIKKFGLRTFLWTVGGLRTLCFAGYAAVALVAYEGFAVLVALSAANTFIRYMEIVGLYSAFMRSSSLRQAGTDFTILSCANLLVYMLGSISAGAIGQYLGYGPLFSLATTLSLLGIAVSMAFFDRAYKPSEPSDTSAKPTLTTSTLSTK
ncbi:MFS transporter [Flexibacterium corallicola]|uniref:MFS transporter n=1 Tax=Flexibacterium corallicola TaxID=3037259 RepID=UPI00286F2CBF|nr:MFS transporter [Pseudovibrio sp. M1P-2-3]